MNSVKDIGINLQRMSTHQSKSQLAYLVQLMFVNNALGIKQLGDINVLNVQKVVSMILSFRIVEKYVKLLITRFRFYQLDTSINQLLHVSVHASTVLCSIQRQITVKNVFLKIVFHAPTKTVHHSVINAVLETHLTLMVNV